MESPKVNPPTPHNMPYKILLEGLAVFIVVALKDLFAGALEDLFGNFSADCVQHNYKSPLYTPDAFARSMVRFAPS